MLRTKMKYKKRAITPELEDTELQFLSSFLLLNEIYPPMKFEVNSSYSQRVMLRRNKICKITKGNHSVMGKCRVMVIVHCTSPQWVMSTHEVSSQ